jgi:hypothetical protein
MFVYYNEIVHCSLNYFIKMFLPIASINLTLQKCTVLIWEHQNYMIFCIKLQAM